MVKSIAKIQCERIINMVTGVNYIWLLSGVAGSVEQGRRGRGRRCCRRLPAAPARRHLPHALPVGRGVVVVAVELVAPARAAARRRRIRRGSHVHHLWERTINYQLELQPLLTSFHSALF